MINFNQYIEQWELTQDGEPIITNTSYLLPVTYQSTKAMLKIALVDEERAGAALMVWWDGEGAARIFQHDGDAILMERAICNRSLMAMSNAGQDDEASKIICAVIATLHHKKMMNVPATLVPLPTWFRALSVAAKSHGGIFVHASLIANELLQNQSEIVALHGDIHHQNILDSGTRGWFAIDPKGLLGDRAYDYANIFCNPDRGIATQPGRLSHQATIIAEAANLDRARLIRWILAYAGLSAAWSIQDGESPDLALAIAAIAKAELEN